MEINIKIGASEEEIKTNITKLRLEIGTRLAEVEQLQLAMNMLAEVEQTSSTKNRI